jgi:hypothetical protein
MLSVSEEEVADLERVVQSSVTDHKDETEKLSVLSSSLDEIGEAVSGEVVEKRSPRCREADAKLGVRKESPRLTDAATTRMVVDFVAFILGVGEDLVEIVSP